MLAWQVAHLRCCLPQMTKPLGAVEGRSTQSLRSTRPLRGRPVILDFRIALLNLLDVIWNSIEYEPISVKLPPRSKQTTIRNLDHHHHDHHQDHHHQHDHHHHHHHRHHNCLLAVIWFGFAIFPKCTDNFQLKFVFGLVLLGPVNNSLLLGAKPRWMTLLAILFATHCSIGYGTGFARPFPKWIASLWEACSRGLVFWRCVSHPFKSSGTKLCRRTCDSRLGVGGCGYGGAWRANLVKTNWMKQNVLSKNLPGVFFGGSSLTTCFISGPLAVRVTVHRLLTVLHF